MKLETVAKLRLIFGLLFAGFILCWVYFVTQGKIPFAREEAAEVAR